MNPRRSQVWLGSVLVILCLLVQPIGVGAQCVVTYTQQGTGTTMGMEYRYVSKYLSMAASCMFVASMSAIGCDPSATEVTDQLNGTAYVSALMGTTPICSWSCDCGSVTMPPTDFPVELMEFGIE